MKKRLILLAGLGVGFILGSRTGRQSYERLKAQAQDLWSDPRVQDTVEKANQSIREKSPAVADAVQTAADKVNAASGNDSPVSEFDGDEDSSANKSDTNKPAADSSSTTKSSAPKSNASKPNASKPSAVQANAAKSGGPKPGPKNSTSPKASDSLADPERSLDDEGPAGLDED